MPFRLPDFFRRRLTDPQRFVRWAEESYGRLEAKKLPSVSLEDSPVARLPVYAVMLVQALLRRTLEQADAFTRELAAGAYTTPFLISRAMLETGCLAADIVLRIDETLTQHDTTLLGPLHETIEKVLYGVKSTSWKDRDLPETINIITVIQRLTKQFGPNITIAYDNVSEVAHPNFAGTLAAFATTTDAAHVTTFVDHPEIPPPMADACLGAAFIALISMEYASTRIKDLLPAFTRLCEEHLHDQGQWPVNMPYPRKQ